MAHDSLYSVYRRLSGFNENPDRTRVRGAQGSSYMQLVNAGLRCRPICDGTELVIFDSRTHATVCKAVVIPVNNRKNAHYRIKGDRQICTSWDELFARARWFQRKQARLKAALLARKETCE